ncbi:MAG: ParB/RepB/Spo0J family partition protein [Archangium sp.]
MPDIRALTTRKVAEGPLPTGAEASTEQLLKVPVDRIRKSPFQPRQFFPEEKRVEMRESLRERGLLEPILLEPDPNDQDYYWLIGGERRWRGHQDLLEETKDPKWSTILAVVRPPSPHGKNRANALVENLQRADLTPLEEGDAYRAMEKEDGLNAEQIAREVGLGVDRIQRCMRIAGGPELLREAMTAGIRVPKLDAEGKPEVKRNPDGSVKMQMVQTRTGEKEIPEPVLVVRVIKELTIAEQLASLYTHLTRATPRNQPKWAEREFKKHLEHVLTQDMEKRRVADYVKRIKAGGKGEEKAAREPAEDKAVKVAPLPKGTPFVCTERQLVVMKDSLGELNPTQRSALRAELAALLASIPEDASAA